MLMKMNKLCAGCGIAFAISLAMGQPTAAPVTPSDQLQSNPAEDLFARGKNLYDAAQSTTDLDQRVQYFQRAEEIFNRYAQDFPQHANAKPAQYYMALCLYHSGRLDDAKRAFWSILNAQNTGPYVAAAAAVLAQDAFQAKDYVSAAMLYRRVSANAVRAADRQRGYYFEALSYHYINRVDQALEAYMKVLNDPEAATSSYLAYARQAAAALLLQTGKPEVALPMFKEVIDSAAPEKSRAESTYLAGLAALQLSQFDLAEKYLQSVLSELKSEWNDYRSPALTALLQLRFNQKKFREVVQLFERESTSETGEAQARRSFYAGRAYMQLQEFRQAIPLLLAVQKNLPNSDLAFDAAYQRLLCFYKIDGAHVSEQVDAFLEIYGKTYADHPSLHAALMMKAGALQNQKKYKEAAACYRSIDVSLIATANKANLLYQKGLCLVQAKDAEAAKSLSQFIKDYPKDERVPEAIAQRGQALLDNGDRNAALADFESLIERKASPELRAFAWQQAAVVKKLNNDLPGMVECYRKLLAEFPDLPVSALANAHFYLGYGLSKQQSAEAITHLQKARELDAKTYGSRAGLLLISSYFLAEKMEPLAEEIDQAIESGYSDQITPALISWAGAQVLAQGKGEQAARFLMLIASPNEPRSTPREVWRHLAKALILMRDYQRALVSIEHVLDVEDQPIARADALLDQARCHAGLKNWADARRSVESCLKLRPQHALEAEANLLFGDVCMAEGKPEEAKQKYAYIATTVDDQRLRPLALFKIIAALEANQERDLAEKYRKELKEQFPQWQAP